jgi:hypothetical protein
MAAFLCTFNGIQVILLDILTTVTRLENDAKLSLASSSNRKFLCVVIEYDHGQRLLDVGICQ